MNDSYYMIDRFLRNNLDDDDYAKYSEALESIAALQPAAAQPQDMREALRTSLMKAFSERIPALSKHHEWYGWPGTFHFAEIAIDVLQAASTTKTQGGNSES